MYLILGDKKINLDKTLLYSLRIVLGLNYYSIIKVCSLRGVNPYIILNILEDFEVKLLFLLFDSLFIIGKMYNKNIFININKLKIIKNLRGIKHLLKF